MSEISNKTEVTTGGLSLTTILFLIFLVLKLTGNIAWSWWWVTAPLWGPFALVIGLVILAIIIFAIILLISAIIKAFN